MTKFAPYGALDVFMAATCLRPDVDALAVLCDRVDRLEAEVRALRAARSRRGDEVESDATFLAVVARSVEAHVFTTKELRAHAAIDPGLAAVLRPYPTNRALGQRLHSLVDRRVGAYLLQRVTRTNGGHIWTVLID